MVKQTKPESISLSHHTCNLVAPKVKRSRPHGKITQSCIKEHLNLSFDKLSEICHSDNLECNLTKMISNTRKTESTINEDTFDSETCRFVSPTQEKPVNQSILLKVELTQEKSFLVIGSCSFRLGPTSDNSYSRDSSCQKKISLKKVNSLVDNEGQLLRNKPRANLISPYIIAYRQKIKKLRTSVRPEVAINPKIIEFNTNQTSFCSCKTSQCLKLYCECFKSLGTCGPSCRCLSCQNNSDNLQIRVSALSKTLTSTYGKTCFRPMSENLINFREPFDDFQNIDFSNLKKQEIFCRCKKSNCSNNYCSCHVGGKKCGSGCNCEACHNLA